DPEDDRGRQERQGGEPGPPVDVPQDRIGHSGHPPSLMTLPSCATRRAGSARTVSQPGARSPSTIAAVLAVLAATQLRAATVTVRHGELTASPLAGSRM